MSKTVEKETTEKIVVINNWKEVNLQKFINIGRIQGDENLKDLVLQQRLRMLALLSNKTYNQILKIEAANLGPLIEATSFLDKAPPKVNKKKPFKLDGKEFIFHPNFKNMTAGEMISVEQLIMDAQHKGENSTPGILAVLIRPTKIIPDGDGTKTTIEEFDAETFESRKNFFLEHLTVDRFYHELAFFLNNAKSSEINSLLSTDASPVKKKKNQKSTKKEK